MVFPPLLVFSPASVEWSKRLPPWIYKIPQCTLASTCQNDLDSAKARDEKSLKETAYRAWREKGNFLFWLKAVKLANKTERCA
jgi:hypothetical protein